MRPLPHVTPTIVKQMFGSLYPVSCLKMVMISNAYLYFSAGVLASMVKMSQFCVFKCKFCVQNLCNESCQGGYFDDSGGSHVRQRIT